jgi:uracil-DNA glycosylase
MTFEEITVLKDFINLASDYLKDGHARVHKTIESEEKTDLPLAYLVEETNEEIEETAIGENRDEESLEAVSADVSACKACGLASTRKNTVPGEGSINPLVMVIGEGPGADEDAAGRPFVGKAGQLLDKMLGSIGLVRGKNCYIANMVKCRPPGNRNPEASEINACYPFLERQILLLKPAIILCVGNVAAQNLLKTSKGITALREERFAEFRIGELTIPVLPTFHPSALLRDESKKRPAWEDLKFLRSRLVEMNLL